MSDENENYEASGSVEQTKKRGLSVNIEVKGKKEIEKLREELADRDAKLQLIAEKHFSRERKRIASRLGMTSEETEEKIETPDDLQFYRGLAEGKSQKSLEDITQRRRAESGVVSGEGASGKATWLETDEFGDYVNPLERDKDGKPIVPKDWRDREYDSVGDMIEVLREIEDSDIYRHSDKRDAKEIHTKLMQKLGEKEISDFKPTSMTYTGSLLDLVNGKGKISDWKKTQSGED